MAKSQEPGRPGDGAGKGGGGKKEEVRQEESGLRGVTEKLSQRCPRCDRPIAMPEQWDEHGTAYDCPAGHWCEAICWEQGDCPEVDWRERCRALEERAEKAERAVTAARKSYVDVADAVCRESSGPEEVAAIARNTRHERDRLAAQVAASEHRAKLDAETYAAVHRRGLEFEDHLRIKLAASERKREEMREALGRVQAAIGDRLLAKGPLSLSYAHAVLDEIAAALSPAAAAPPREVDCPGCKIGEEVDRGWHVQRGYGPTTRCYKAGPNPAPGGLAPGRRERGILDRCPSCGGQGLFIGGDGYSDRSGWLTCSYLECKEPVYSRALSAATAKIQSEMRSEADARVRAAASDMRERAASVAESLFFAPKTAKFIRALPLPGEGEAYDRMLATDEPVRMQDPPLPESGGEGA